MKYYYVRDLLIYAKGEGHTTGNYLFIDGEWKPDTEHIVADRLVGYDSYEDDDSPYKMGSTSIMDDLMPLSLSDLPPEIRKLETDESK